MSVIEAELVKLFKFKKSPEDFFDRQDYLDAICQAMDKIKDDKVFDDMTEPTYDWLQEAVEAHNKKREIPDFPDAEPEEVEGGSEAEEAEIAGEETDPEMDEETPEETAEEEATEGEQEAEEVPQEPELDVEEPATVSEPAESPKKPRKVRKGHGGTYIKKKRGKPDVEPKNKPGNEPDYRKVTGEKDRYGVTAGTKASIALKMFEKGCTMRDANIELGDNYYVILRRLVKQGHRLEKLENRVLKLTHKNDLPKKKGK